MKKNIIYSLIVIVLYGVIWLIFAFHSSSSWPGALVEHEISYLHPFLQQIWLLDNVYIGEDQQSFLVAGDERVFIYGTNAQTSQSQVIALEASTGRELWNKKLDVMAMLYQSGLLIVGGGRGIYAINPLDGKTLWSDSGGPFIEIYVVDGLLYADAKDRYYVISPETGKIEHEIKGPPFWRSGAGISTWEYYFDRTLSVDWQTGRAEWYYEEDIASNLILSNPYLFALSRDGKLLQVNLKTEKITPLIEFEPNPLLDQTVDLAVLSYYIYSDSDYLFVYLGDSRQLFAFKFLGR